ncbi:unnamed protein product [Psylliodes chrysocephalus]|uniref:Myb/SANT-like DNA-binding domain-containing protein n=1 Tax=Psylliodes chrysocephalus TaxID=3402493 RepID=A0A9P0GHX3_9CUCU|nr:unnamed protein product [Psylliodes chrysocephala]
MHSTEIYINNVLYTITDEVAVIKRILTDEEYATSFIIGQIENGDIDLEGSETLDIQFQRPSSPPSQIELNCLPLNNKSNFLNIPSTSSGCTSSIPSSSTSTNIIPSDGNKNINVWQQKGKPNEMDGKVTCLLLKLRGSTIYTRKFNDKCSVKNKLWEEIAKKMGEEGFCVSGVQSQQKFMNLSKKYIMTFLE